MKDDIKDIAAYYNNDSLQEHTWLERHQLGITSPGVIFARAPVSKELGSPRMKR